jgi:hypothetical protein
MKVGNLVRWRFAPDPLATHLVLSFHSGNKKICNVLSSNGKITWINEEQLTVISSIN